MTDRGFRHWFTVSVKLFFSENEDTGPVLLFQQIHVMLYNIIQTDDVLAFQPSYTTKIHFGASACLQ